MSDPFSNRTSHGVQVRLLAALVGTRKMKPAPRRLRCGAFKISLIVGYLQIFDNAARTKLASNHRRKCREPASRTLGWPEGKQFADAPSYFHITNRIGAVMMRAFGTQPPRQGGAVRRSRSLGLEMLWRISVTAGATILLCLLACPAPGNDG